MTLGFVTPSFYADFERCQLLCESLERFCKTPYRHYILVDRSDVDLFKRLQSQSVEVVEVQDILPKWLLTKRIPLPKKNRYVYLSGKSQPVRGWVAQQMAKLQFCSQLETEHAIIADSDVMLIRPLKLEDLLIDGLSPLLCTPGEVTSSKPELVTHVRWQRIAENMLGLPPAPEPLANYITPFNFCRPQTIRDMSEKVQAVTGRDWMVSIARAPTFSEFFLYGIYVTSQSPETCGHRLISEPLSHSYWQPRPLSSEEMKAFLDNRPANAYALHIQSKADMPVESYAFLVRGV